MERQGTLRARIKRGQGRSRRRRSGPGVLRFDV